MSGCIFSKIHYILQNIMKVLFFIITKIYKVIIMLEQHKRSSQKFSKLQHHILFLLKAIVCYKKLLTKWKLIIKHYYFVME